MSFSERQQHCLEAMGIVPWVVKSEPFADQSASQPVVAEKVGPVPAAATILAPAALASSATLVVEAVFDAAASTTLVSKPALIAMGPMPEAVDALKLWMPSQPLGLLSVRSQPRSFVGQPDAPLLVVVDSMKSAASAQPPATPFSAEAAQLFELMMRAIAVTLGQRKLCCLASGSDSQDTVSTDNLMDICTPQTRAVLLLVNDWNTLSTPVTDHFKLDQPALPVWRIPHPDVLLEFNQLKRQAWTSLQALQSALS